MPRLACNLKLLSVVDGIADEVWSLQILHDELRHATIEFILHCFEKHVADLLGGSKRNHAKAER